MPACLALGCPLPPAHQCTARPHRSTPSFGVPPPTPPHPSQGQPGDLLLLAAGPVNAVNKALDRVRQYLAHSLDLIKVGRVWFAGSCGLLAGTALTADFPLTSRHLIHDSAII